LNTGWDLVCGRVDIFGSIDIKVANGA